MSWISSRGLRRVARRALRLWVTRSRCRLWLSRLAKHRSNTAFIATNVLAPLRTCRREWRAGRPPENGDGLRFTSPDGESFISVSGSFNIGDTVAEALENELLADDGETVTYRDKRERMSVVSGTRGTVIFYRKAMLSCNDQIVNRVSIEYPAARKASFDALVTHVAGSLKGGKGWQTENCR